MSVEQTALASNEGKVKGQEAKDVTGCPSIGKVCTCHVMGKDITAGQTMEESKELA